MDEEEKEYIEKELNKDAFAFMKSNGWFFFVQIVRVFLIFALVGVAVYMYSEIETVKFLLHDPCKVCINKTGATCWVGQLPMKTRTVYPTINFTTMESENIIIVEEEDG